MNTLLLLVVRLFFTIIPPSLIGRFLEAGLKEIETDLNDLALTQQPLTLIGDLAKLATALPEDVLHGVEDVAHNLFEEGKTAIVDKLAGLPGGVEASIPKGPPAP